MFFFPLKNCKQADALPQDKFLSFTMSQVICAGRGGGGGEVGTGSKPKAKVRCPL